MEAQLLQEIFDFLFVASHCFAAFMGWQAGSAR